MSMPVPEAKASMARAYASGKAPKLLAVLPDGHSELWALDDVVFVLPVVPADAPPLFEYALRLRREASLTGACDQCGASLSLEPVEAELSRETGAPFMGDAIFAHRSNCPANDNNIYPLLEKYLKKRTSSNLDDNLSSVKHRTRKNVLDGIPESRRIDLDVTDELKDKTNKLLDERLAAGTVKTCGHLRSEPVQTWHLLLWNDTWNCGECAIRFGEAVRRGAFRLDRIEDNSCDFCHRYAPTTLTPIVLRADIWIMHGAICRRCAPEWGHREEVK
jgi:hypothetical protein